MADLLVHHKPQCTHTQNCALRSWKRRGPNKLPSNAEVPTNSQILPSIPIEINTHEHRKWTGTCLESGRGNEVLGEGTLRERWENAWAWELKEAFVQNWLQIQRHDYLHYDIDTVDGRNPPSTYKVLYIRGCSPDFFHQPYYGFFSLIWYIDVGDFRGKAAGVCNPNPPNWSKNNCRYLTGCV